MNIIFIWNNNLLWAHKINIAFCIISSHITVRLHGHIGHMHWMIELILQACYFPIKYVAFKSAVADSSTLWTHDSNKYCLPDIA